MYNVVSCTAGGTIGMHTTFQEQFCTSHCVINRIITFHIWNSTTQHIDMLWSVPPITMTPSFLKGGASLSFVVFKSCSLLFAVHVSVGCTTWQNEHNMNRGNHVMGKFGCFGGLLTRANAYPYHITTKEAMSLYLNEKLLFALVLCGS